MLVMVSNKYVLQLITYTNVCILRLLHSRSSRAYCDNATKVMCVANVIFGRERLTEQRQLNVRRGSYFCAEIAKCMQRYHCA